MFNNTTRKINKIIVHCSDSEFGDAATIKLWHKERGFENIGYHYVILNSHPTSVKITSAESDGKIENGRDVSQPGAHCIGYNKESIGICLIGKKKFTDKQIASLKSLLKKLTAKYGLNISDILGHCETDNGKEQGKTCPNIDMDKLRSELEDG